MKKNANLYLITSLLLITLLSLVIYYIKEPEKSYSLNIEEIDLSKKEAESIIVNYEPNKDYYFKKKIIIEKTKTLTPFTYEEKIIKEKNLGYFSRKD